MKEEQYKDYYDGLVDERTPIDFIEPLENINSSDYREASLHFLRIMNLCMSYIVSSKDTLTAAYGVVYALGLGSVVDGKSMRELSSELDISGGTLSNHAKSVRLLTGLPPSSLQLDLESADVYRKTREAKLDQ